MPGYDLDENPPAIAIEVIAVIFDESVLADSQTAGGPGARDFPDVEAAHLPLCDFMQD